MSLQLLHHLFGLQVPHVDGVVFRAADDPLATGDREPTETAVLFIFVARIRFEAFARVVIPQTNRVVQRARQDILAVRRKLDERSTV